MPPIPFTNFLSIEPLLDPAPLTVTPQTSVGETIRSMHQAGNSPDCDRAPQTDPAPQMRLNPCVVVIDQSRPVGIFSAEEVVRVVAEGIPLETTPISAVMQAAIAPIAIDDLLDLRSICARMQQQHLSYLPVVDRQGHWLGLLSERAIAQALTHAPERAREAELLAQINTLQVLYNQAPCGYHSLDPQGHIIQINDTELQMLGYPREEMIGRPITDFLTPESIQTFQYNYPQFQQRGWLQDTEFHLIRKDGSIVPVSANAKAIYDAAGNYCMSHTIVVDITERKQLERQIRASETKLSNLLESAIVSIASFRVFADRTWHYEHWSAGCEQLFGYSITELMADDTFWISQVLPEDRDTVLMPLFEHFFAERNCSAEYQFRRKDGAIHWFSSTFTSTHTDDGSWLVTAVNTDITALKQVEIRCTEMATELQTLYDHAPCGYRSIDAEGYIIRINETALAMMGYPREEVIGRKITDFYTLESRQRFDAGYADFKERGVLYNGRFELVRKDGSILPISVTANAVYDDDGNYVMSNSVLVDISEQVQLETDRKAAEAALQESEFRYRQLCEFSPTGILRNDIQGNCTYANPTTLTMTGLSFDETLYQRWAQNLHPDDRERLAVAWSTFISQCNLGQEASYQIEHRYLHPEDGSVRWMLVQAVPEKNTAGELVGFIGSVIDITHLKQTQAALQQRLTQEQLIAEITQDIRQSLDLNTVLHRTVERVRQILATDRVVIFKFQPDWQGKVVMESVDPEFPAILSTQIYDPCFSDRYVEPYRQGRVSMMSDLYAAEVEPCYVELLEHFQVRANLVVPIVPGADLWGLLIVHHCSAARHWQSEEVELLQQLATHVGIAIQQSELYQQTRRELLERQQMQLALEASEERFRSLSTSAPLAICQTNADGLCLYTNARWTEMSGLSLNESLGDGWLKVLHPDDRPALLAAWERYLQGEPSFFHEFRIINTRGEIRWISARNAPIRSATGEITGHVGTKEDITDRKQTEAALLESQAQLQRQLVEIETIYQSAPIGLNVLDRDLRFVRINQHLAEMNGLPIEAHLGRTIWDVLPNLADQAEQLLLHILDTGEPLLNVEIRGETPAQPGVERIWLEQFWPLKSGDRIIGISTVCEEITDRKRLETELQQRERQFATLVENLPDVIVRLDRQLRYLYVSPNTEQESGFSPEAMLGKTIWELDLPSDLCQSLVTSCQQAFETGQGQTIELCFEDRQYLVRLIPERDAQGEIISLIGISENITEKKKLEEQFYRAQRMESLGTLASGIAHDLNNVFTPILAIAQLLMMKQQNLDERSREMLQVLVDSSKRGANLVKQVLTSIRGFEGNRSALQAETVLQEVTNIIQQTFPKSIEIHDHRPDTPLWPVFADPTQLHQVLMNLCINARDAMPDGGILSILIENRSLDRAYAQMNLDAHEGDYVVITIGDTGSGIAPHLINRIFDPFFTTKDPGKGTGLGLSTVLGIVKNHGGFVQVYSEVGQGTQFRVYLPAIAGSVTPSVKAEELLYGQGELILIVDDETLVQQVIRTLLEDFHYTTLIAQDGIEAISIYADRKQEIDVVLLDMMMPNMDGATTIRTIKRMNPEVKIIAASGLPANQTSALAAGANAFLAKPYTTEDLLRTLHQLVHAAPEPLP